MAQSIRTQIGVKACAECPFYERGPVSILADFALRRGTQIRSGTCRFGGLGQAFPLGRAHVANELEVPTACPLRSGDALVKFEGA